MLQRQGLEQVRAGILSITDLIGRSPFSSNSPSLSIIHQEAYPHIEIKLLHLLIAYLLY